MVKATILGAGSWGTTYAKILCDAGCDTTLYARNPARAQRIAETGRNDEYLPDIALPTSLTVTSDVAEALKAADIVGVAIPVQQIAQSIAHWSPLMRADATVVSLAKGVETHSLRRVSEVICDEGAIAQERILVVSGPNLAKEIALGQPAATVIAGIDAARRDLVQRCSTTPYLRPYTNSDVIGCELAGAIKNVIALACGMVQGMGYGDNTIATLITRGLAEMTRLGAVLGADPLTFAGLAGVGDVIATCSSPLSRNHIFGRCLGMGQSLAQAKAAAKQTVEGVNTAIAVWELAQRHRIDMPITEQVMAVCHHGAPPAEALVRLMQRTTKAE